ncbi:MAG: DUF6512 family protein [Eubacteriales bacterium]|nr:DUF6512 family protein [Eubacteriales bacterium]
MSFRKNVFRFLLVGALGVLLHFAYAWSGNNRIVGFIGNVNESTWEHLKLLFFPFVFLTIGECLFIRKKPIEFLRARTLGILSGMIFIVCVFYVVWGVSGMLVDYINITIYFLGVLCALWVENKQNGKRGIIDSFSAICILVFIAILFIMFTYRHPNIGIFYNPVNHPKRLSYSVPSAHTFTIMHTHF